VLEHLPFVDDDHALLAPLVERHQPIAQGAERAHLAAERPLDPDLPGDLLQDLDGGQGGVIEEGDADAALELLAQIVAEPAKDRGLPVARILADEEGSALARHDGVLEAQQALAVLPAQEQVLGARRQRKRLLREAPVLQVVEDFGRGCHAHRAQSGGRPDYRPRCSLA
jgi:hypothetical protein